MNHDLLWTSKCFLTVLVLGILCLMKGLRKEPIRRSFQAIFQKPLAASSAVVLVFFLSIAVLDCIELNFAGDYGSILDQVLAPLNVEVEKTYSEPMSLTLFSSEMEVVDGHPKEVFPRLVYPSKRFHTADQKNRWVFHVVMKAILWSALVTLCLAFCWRIFRRHLSLPVKSSLVTLFVVLVIVISSYWLSRELHILGTGKIGEDIFYNSVKSIRTGLVLGLLTTLLMMPLALILGISAGFFGGVIDDIIQYVYTTLSSIPGVLLITASVLSMQTYIANHPQYFRTLNENADARLLALCLILGVTSWTSLCRLLRAEVLKLREVDFVLAAKVLGSSSYQIIMRHLLPNVMPIVVITLVLDFSFLVLAEAVLSYVGVGVSPMTISWGNMINAARLELAREPM
ncbi:MAG: ABC transporter permease, partial [Legionellales bacterium]|nr:ABC transporter permease [Legionellales bacterium]